MLSAATESKNKKEQTVRKRPALFYSGEESLDKTAKEDYIAVSTNTNCIHTKPQNGERRENEMPHINKKRPDTRLEIIQLAARLFLEEGYSCTSCAKIAKALDLSTGNITFYFPSKEHLLAILDNELFDFQKKLIEYFTKEGKTSLLSYCLELTTIAAACEADEAARDFFISSYSSEMALGLIRENDTEKTKMIFGEYHPEWTDEQWAATENIVSGIEYATLMTSEENIPLPLQIETALNSIMMLYGVPEETRKIKIEKVFATDYRALGKTILAEFKKYINSINEKNLKQAIKEKSKK